MTTQTTPQKSAITERLRTDLGRSVGVTIATQLVWLTWLIVLETNLHPTPVAKERANKVIWALNAWFWVTMSNLSVIWKGYTSKLRISNMQYLLSSFMSYNECLSWIKWQQKAEIYTDRVIYAPDYSKTNRKVLFTITLDNEERSIYLWLFYAYWNILEICLNYYRKERDLTHSYDKSHDTHINVTKAKGCHQKVGFYGPT